MEVSVIASRNTKGEIKTFPLVENIHEKNILRQTIAPARTNNEVSQKASKIASDTMNVLNGAGVFGIEMFVTQDDDIVINEIAPRVHNSGHLTMNAHNVSQFENHIRAVCNLKLIKPKRIHKAIMYNILGNDIKKYRSKEIAMKEFFYDYGKKEIKNKRKMGHLTKIF